MKFTIKERESLETVAKAHFLLHQRINAIVFLEGPKLFESIKDMSLDSSDIERIENKLFRMLEKYPEFKEYVKARKKTVPIMTTLMTRMKSRKPQEWKALVELELSLEISQGIKQMASKIGMSYGAKGYIQ